MWSGGLHVRYVHLLVDIVYVPRRAAAAIGKSELLISPMVLLELEYLYEIHRIIQPPQGLLNQLASQIGLRVCDHPFPAIVLTG